MVDNKTMTNILTSDQTLQKKVDDLITAANDAGGKDNITVVLLHNNKKPLKQKATKPISVKKNDIQKPEQQKQLSETRLSEKRINWLAVLLLLLCVIFLAAFLWQWQKNTVQKNPVNPGVQKNLNAVEQKLQDSIRHAGNILILEDSIFNKGIIINDTILIEKDSFRLNGNGVIIKSDSAYKGAAFFISSQSKHLLLENIIFENFDVAIITNSPNINFRNVRFQNCRVAIQYQLAAAGNQMVNGRLKDSVLFIQDSLRH
jgi:hypothetical protein